MKSIIIGIVCLLSLLLYIPSATAWQTVKYWQGNGLINTEPFKITSKQWRISWSIKSEETFDPVFQIFVYKEDEDFPDVAANQMSPDSGTSYMYTGPGSYHLTINTVFCSWVVAVEDNN